jgi:hypothetical protein
MDYQEGERLPYPKQREQQGTLQKLIYPWNHALQVLDVCSHGLSGLEGVIQLRKDKN